MQCKSLYFTSNLIPGGFYTAEILFIFFINTNMGINKIYPFTKCSHTHKRKSLGRGNLCHQATD